MNEKYFISVGMQISSCIRVYTRSYEARGTNF